KKLFFIIVFLLSAAAVVCAAQGSARRFISLAPSTTEVLFALGLDDQIVGVSSYCNFPREAQNKEIIGSFSQPNIEKILSLKPDYVFCTGLEQAPVVAELKRLGLNVYVADPQTIEAFFQSVREMGRITAKEAQAEEMLRGIEKDLAEVSSRVLLVPQEKRPKVFIEIYHDPLTTAGKGSFVDELITLAGGVNIAADTKRPYSIFSAEQVISRDPDCILLAYMDIQAPQSFVANRFGWNRIKAVKNKRVYNDINADLLLRPGPRIGEGVKEAHRHFYP
ncbi:MAG: cobalamin-binding protein, partial [Candidatus Omnitrophica bacterium]|nr:cobalamin-binding protein [Candidatus Omnitrophota bacterium]